MNSKQEVKENLLMADEYMGHMFPDIKKLNLTITGGSSFLLKGFSNKFTLDIDCITELEPTVADFLESFAINNHAVEVTKLPSGYEERLVKCELKLNVLEIYLLSNEDLILSKIGRCSTDDIADILNTNILERIDLSTLIQLGEQLCREEQTFVSKWNYFNSTILGEMVA